MLRGLWVEIIDNLFKHLMWAASDLADLNHDDLDDTSVYDLTDEALLLADGVPLLGQNEKEKTRPSVSSSSNCIMDSHTHDICMVS